MKNSFILIFLLFAAYAGAQNNMLCYNGGITSVASGTTSSSVPSSIEQKNSLILMPYVMKEKEVMVMLKEKNNASINKLLKKVKLSKDFETISIAAIPETLLGAGFMGIASATTNNGNSSQQKEIAVGLLAASAVCLTSSLCFRLMHKKNYKKAIQQYNQLYN